MSSTPHPFVRLRQRIQQAKRQFRHSRDNSPSLFNPSEGFAYGYDIELIESALSAYEQAMGSELSHNVFAKEQLLQQADRLCVYHEDEGVREFAHQVKYYLEQGQAPKMVPAPVRLRVG